MARVSENSRYTSTQNRIGMVRQMADETQETAISGRKLHKMSDDPVAAVRVLKNKTKLENIRQYRKTLDFAKGYLSKTEDALLGVNESLMRAKELSVQQSNATWDANTRATVAEEIRELADHVVQLGNSTYGDRYVFGGFQTGQPPIAPDGNFLGDDGLVFVQVDEDSFRPINIPGREIFDVPPAEDGKNKPVVQVLRQIYGALKNNDMNTLHSSMQQLDLSLSRMIQSTASLGARRASIDDVGERLDRSEERLFIDNNELEAADPVKSAMDLKRAETAMQYTLQSSAKILSPSLMSFLGPS